MFAIRQPDMSLISPACVYVVACTDTILTLPVDASQGALAFHARPLVIFSAPLLVWWFMDTLYGLFFNTFLIENPEVPTECSVSC